MISNAAVVFEYVWKHRGLQSLHHPVRLRKCADELVVRDFDDKNLAGVTKQKGGTEGRFGTGRIKVSDGQRNKNEHSRNQYDNVEGLISGFRGNVPQASCLWQRVVILELLVGYCSLQSTSRTYTEGTLGKD